uniref:Uncharacterized protein n=1 Tax=Scophthalmus maximus TaxID=52904 RepID=A0A8D3B758_SCOMX
STFFNHLPGYVSDMAPIRKHVVKRRGGKRKKQILKFTLVFTHPVEDGITLNEEDIKLNGKAGKLVRYLKYLIFRSWLQSTQSVTADCLKYFYISLLV